MTERKYPIQEFSHRACEAAHPHRQELGHFFNASSKD
jgi:hypothetical protein